jgi:hypothetical protein
LQQVERSDPVLEIFRHQRLIVLPTSVAEGSSRATGVAPLRTLVKPEPGMLSAELSSGTFWSVALDFSSFKADTRD